MFTTSNPQHGRMGQKMEHPDQHGKNTSQEQKNRNHRETWRWEEEEQNRRRKQNIWEYS